MASEAEEGKKTRGGLLLVEDNEADILFFKRALSRTKSPAPLEVVVNGVEAVQHLSGAGAYGDRSVHPLPSIVLLDLKLPRMSGLEVLEWMKTHPGLREVRTVVLTSSSEESDIRRAYALGALCYVVKPVESVLLHEVVAAIAAAWADPGGSALSELARHAASVPALP
jgi:CheY-like chemotaxis protein